MPSSSHSTSVPSRRAAATAVALAALLLPPAFGSAQQPDPTQPVDQIVIGVSAQRFALPDCVPHRGDQLSREACRTIVQVLRNDLRFEGLFQFVPDSLLRAIPAQNPEAPNFEDWKSVGTSILVVTRAQVESGELTVEVKAYFVETGQSMLAKRYSGSANNPRIFAHQASDDIVALTQYKGIARTKIAFTSDRDSGEGKRSKELYIVDYDGHDPRRLTVNRSINILPAWAPDGRSLAYISYRRGSPLVFLAAIFEGRSTPNLTREQGSQAFAPAFSPDGQQLAFASNRSGNMDIWVASANGGGARQITRSPAADIAPGWSPTGREIAFTSNRGGTPQIYIMDAEGLNVRRLTTVGNHSDSPAWNPSREFTEVAYTSRLDGGFEIAVVDLATRQVRQITQGRGSCEYPSWAPNGRHLVFACNRGRKWQITVSDREGRNVRTLPAGPGNNVQPEWGP